MPIPVFLSPKNDSFLYRIGRTGFDSGLTDPGGVVYSGVLETERASPAGEHGYVHFRRVGLRLHRSGSFTIEMRVFVDEVQTKLGDGSDQVIIFTKEAPAGGLEETLLEADISAAGTFIEVELTIDSDQVDGVFLPEGLEVHIRPIRGVIQQGAEAT